MSKVKTKEVVVKSEVEVILTDLVKKEVLIIPKDKENFVKSVEKVMDFFNDCKKGQNFDIKNLSNKEKRIKQMVRWGILFLQAGKNKSKRIDKMIDKMSDEEKRAFIEQLKS